MPKRVKTGGGSRKGKPNKFTADVKAMIIEALNKAGGVGYLVDRAKDNPAAFIALVGKVLPLQVSGTDGGPIIIVTGIDRGDDDSKAG